MVISLALCDIHSVIKLFYPKTATITYDLFISGSYHHPQTVLWYMFELANLLNKIIWCYILAAFGKKIHPKLFWMGIILLCYEITQFFFYIWNRNSSFMSNAMVYCAVGVAIIEIFWPTKRTGIVKSME